MDRHLFNFKILLCAARPLPFFRHVRSTSALSLIFLHYRIPLFSTSCIVTVTHKPLQNIVVIGGGIIGCTSAYYISYHPSFSSSTTSLTILEASSIAGGASGKAGGLVAKWAYPRELVDVTFKEHERLAQKHAGAERWGWRYTNCDAVWRLGVG